MKTTLFRLLALCALLALLPATALAYIAGNPVDGYSEIPEDELPVLYGTLNTRMATRTGPSTDYTDFGTYFSAGETLRVISLAYDRNDIPWVQVEFTYRNRPYRAYTGLKRFDGLSAEDIPLELGGIAISVTQDTTPRHGPGEDYPAYDFVVREGKTGELIASENGYLLVDLEYADGEERVWLDGDACW